MKIKIDSDVMIKPALKVRFKLYVMNRGQKKYN